MQVKREIYGFQIKYREALTHVVRQWQKRKNSNFRGEQEDLAKALLVDGLLDSRYGKRGRSLTIPPDMFSRL